MPRLVRFGVSLDAGLLGEFDAHIKDRGYTNRSEALRDLIRERLVAEEWRAGPEEAAGVVSLVYDHHQLDLPKRLTDMQHDHHDMILSTLHVHLDHHNCLEVIILKGRGTDAKRFADHLLSLRGVLHGKLVLTNTGAANHEEQ